MTALASASGTVPAPSPDRVADFHRNGFLVLRRLTTPEDLARIRELMAGLYRKYEELAHRRRAHDLGGDGAGPARILEINQTVELQPALADTATFRACRALAEMLLGRAVEHRFDHAIHKPPFNGRATPWHQDEAYSLDPNLVTAHFWVPLQDVTVEMGCMHFIPGSHQQPLRRHHRRDHLRGAHALETDEVDDTKAVACPLQAGDATVHFARTLHYSGPNLTAVPRMAWSLEFGPRRALVHRVIAKTRLFWRRARRRR